MGNQVMQDTPSGKIQKKAWIGRGAALFVMDNEEVYIRLLRLQNELIPDDFRTVTGWYHQKDFKIIAMVFPNIFPIDVVLKARQYFREVRFDIFEKFTGTRVLPTKLASYEKYAENWFKIHSEDWVERCSWDSEIHENVEKGMVLVKVALGGNLDDDENYLLVPKELYDQRQTEFGAWFSIGEFPKRVLASQENENDA